MEGQSTVFTVKGKQSIIQVDADALITDSQNQVGQYSGSWGATRTFTRAVWLPGPNNPSEVEAKLEDGRDRSVTVSEVLESYKRTRWKEVTNSSELTILSAMVGSAKATGRQWAGVDKMK